MIGLTDFLGLVLIGALCSLDTVSVAQAMVSRPLVSGTLGGAALGRAGDGLVVGAVMELFALETLPFGASRYPEWGSAGVVAGATYVVGGARTPGSLAVAVLAGLAVAGLGSISMVWHRRFVATVAGNLRDSLAAGSGDAVTRLHITGIASDLWRGLLVTAIGLAFAFAVTARLLGSWFVAYGPSLAWPIVLATAVGAASIVRAARPAGALWHLTAGVAIGVVAVFVQ